MDRRNFLKYAGTGIVSAGMCGAISPAIGAGRKRPNILWICAEDMSPHMSCYGERTIETPNIDRLAREGVRFENAFITCPVCSPSRSAMITGMYQTSSGAHNHRSSRHKVELKLPGAIKFVPEYFKRAGYYTSNGGMLNLNDYSQTKAGKTDYNLVFDNKMYDAAEWSGRKDGQPFFAQLQLKGGKNRGAKVPDPVDPKDVKLPPYYPDDPALREDWARYLNSVINTDIEVGRVLKRLEDEGIADETIVFFWTDHGISHIRGKQFLYDEGIRIPLIVRGPGLGGSAVRTDLVEHIDIPATSMALAGLGVPDHFQGRSLFNADYRQRECAFAARDRCDETVERIRCVRTHRYKYIRNYYWHVPHTQANRYKDGKEIMKVMRRLHAEGKLDENQAKPFAATRPVEELYDLKADPHEINNLAENTGYAGVLRKFSARLNRWIEETRDLGQLPEPVIADYLKQYETPRAILENGRNREVARRINEVWALAQAGDAAIDDLVQAMKDRRPQVRYAAAFWLGNIADNRESVTQILMSGLKDDADYVRVASARALCLIDETAEPEALDVLVSELQGSDNEVVRHYAACALEDMGPKAKSVLAAIEEARSQNYEYVKRVTARIVDTHRQAK